MNKRSLAVLLRARMRPNNSTKLAFSPLPNRSGARAMQPSSDNANKPQKDFEHVRDSMHSAISMNKTEVIDTVLNDFSEGYFSLCYENRRRLLLVLAKEYDLNRTQVCELIKQYLGVLGEEAQSAGHEEDGVLGSFYRIERNLRHALKPMYEGLFERLNMHPGGLKVLTSLRADILSILAEENIASLRALDSYLKEKLGTWLSPAALELHQITWDDPASLLEKIVAYEAVHPISNLLDLKRRLGVGRRCFGYLHAAIPGEPLIFIEVALLKNVAQTIQEVLWDDPPIPECEATCALFYSISSTQRGLAGINLGKFLIKRVITLVKRDMPHISTFATISPIPGFIQWLLSKLASQSKLAEVNDISQSSADRSGSAFRENILEPEEEKALMDLSEYLLQEKKRGKALDSVANFHLQNGAMIERINWMADRSENGLHQSAGIMVNYAYRLENIEEYAQSYFSTGQIHASDEVCDVCHYVEPLYEHQPATDKRG
ncbi:malonyl-CoA decarboxylase, mitochondrial isoform X3 [Citrus clementina]|uniref:malonyl-CoA decarboxylase, mitochondrial isoform X3 n=1 Tax=Citrus clementina TaxID=85681 RepID=UPI000CED0964|nr:malonyl-CoA decarboxylase, mitochondrial isoform X3 [Citrus x clementina]